MTTAATWATTTADHMDRMRAALQAAADRFREYERLHAAKPDHDKAKRNADMAELCEAALRGVEPPPATVSFGQFPDGSAVIVGVDLSGPGGDRTGYALVTYPADGSGPCVVEPLAFEPLPGTGPMVGGLDFQEPRVIGRDLATGEDLKAEPTPPSPGNFSAGKQAVLRHGRAD